MRDRDYDSVGNLFLGLVFSFPDTANLKNPDTEGMLR